MALKPGYFLVNNVNSETMNVFIQERPDIPAPSGEFRLYPLSHLKVNLSMTMMDTKQRKWN